MEAVGAGLGIADLCIRYGILLVEVCKSYRKADQEIREAILKIEAHWLKIQHQLEFLRKIWPNLDEDYRIHQNTVLQVLQAKVQAAATLVDGIIGEPEESSVKTIKSKKGEARRLKYATWRKSSLENVLADLKDWSEVFDMSWYLITLQPSAAIDDELHPVKDTDNTSLSALKDLRHAVNSTSNPPLDEKKSPVFISLEKFDDKTTTIEHSSIELWRDTDGSNSFVVDSPNNTSTLSHACNLAKRLRTVEPMQFGILRCHGILKQGAAMNNTGDQGSTRFVFSLPFQSTQPDVLRNVLLGGIGAQVLDERFSIARQLAKAVMFVHSVGFVHKNIRPETILILRGDTQEPHAALTGFKSFRLDEGQTFLRGDDEWEANLYRHPTRQGAQPEDTYSMQHDIYSLGVCLLEIGIADSLVLYDASGNATPNSTLTENLDSSIKGPRKKAFETKRALVKIASDQLPAKMGRKYAEIVLTCLTCLDSTENSFGTEAEFLDENGLLVGVRFIEKVRADSYLNIHPYNGHLTNLLGSDGSP
jgi:serine/threonine protein kinase